MDTIWPSNSNKLLLEKLIYNHPRTNISTLGGYANVIGQVSRKEGDWRSIRIHEEKEYTESHHQSTFEEADFRIPFFCS